MTQAKSGGRHGERRAHTRKIVELPVLVHEAGNRVRGALRFDAQDLSLGGAFLRSDLLFEIGEELELEFQVPSGAVVRVRSRVVRVARDAGPAEAGMGIAFVDLAEADARAVRAFISGG